MMILRMISEKLLDVLTRMLWDIFQFQVGYFKYLILLFSFLFSPDFTHILENLGDKLASIETQEMMILADEDGDGNINYEEFISLLFKVGWLGYSVHNHATLVLETKCASGDRKGDGWSYIDTFNV